MSCQVAKVAVSAATYHIDKMYEYLIPDKCAQLALPGMRVIVPFGRGDKKVEGVILSTDSKGKYGKLKSIDSAVDGEALFGADSIKLALWMRERFFCTVYDAFRCMLPSKTHFKYKMKSREPFESDAAQAEQFKLSSGQSEVFREIALLLESGKPQAALLYGVTGSGKTLVYIELIKAVLKLGKTAIVLVPEIALTPQAVSIFESHFSGTVAVLHSALGDGERYTEWKRIREGSVSVVVGTRSAVFAPLRNIGIIVIDEEQEHTYKSDISPRYHAREVAKYRVTQASGLLLLASATPSVESMYAAKAGKYKLLRLMGRFNEKDLPPVIIADMKKELKEGNGGQISSVLRCELEKNIKRDEQSILFINRRGANTSALCGECGYTFKCRNCSVSMTYHISNKRLLCHYCGFSMPRPEQCPECAGKIKYVGAGTQKVEQELEALFPGIGIIRMDADTTTKKNSHHRLLAEFRKSRAQVLLGTQMVTKGLDFENVTLVGVLCADLSLYTSDYKANEKTFSLITQVIGRGGRGNLPGRAVIQTFTPENKVITLASKQDYDAFYDSEIALRQALANPPVRDLLSLTAMGADEKKVSDACNTLMYMLRNYFRGDKSVGLLGPAPAAIPKISNKYFYKLMVNCESNRRIREIISHVMREFARGKSAAGVTVYADTE